MSKHYAIVKCDRYQVGWKNKSIGFQYFKEAYLNSKDELNSLLSDNYFYHKYEIWAQEYCERWLEAIKNSKLYGTLILNGECILWEGDVNQERLRVGDNLYIPSIKTYLPINEVRLKADGEVVYYVNYHKKFYDTAEQDRQSAINDWFLNHFEGLDTFEELQQYQYKNIPLMQDYLDTVSAKPEKNIIAQTSIDDYTPTPETMRDKEDLSWENILLICGIGAIVIITAMIMISL